MQVKFKAVTQDFDIHIFRAVLCRTSAQSVQAERIFIIAAVIVIILSAGIKLTEYEFPIITFFLFVIVNGNTPAEVLDLD